MSRNLVTLDLDVRGAIAALDTLEAEVRARTLEACRVTAEAIDRTATARLERQLGPGATGETARGIESRLSYDGEGYVVLVDNSRQPNLPLWLEKGTRAARHHAATRARPFFYVAVELEAPGHQRRLVAAGEAARDAAGLTP